MYYECARCSHTASDDNDSAAVVMMVDGDGYDLLCLNRWFQWYVFVYVALIDAMHNRPPPPKKTAHAA